MDGEQEIKDVRKVYGVLNASWYDWFKARWDSALSNKLIGDLNAFLMRNIDENKKVLELGVGTGVNIERTLNLGLRFRSYTGLDITDDMLNQAKKKFKNNKTIKLVKFDLNCLDTINGRYDTIICTWVLSHFQEPHKVFNNAYKLLNKNGKMFFIFMTKPKLWISFWFRPLAWLFKADYVAKDKIEQFVGRKIIRQYSANLAMVVEVSK